ncbi:hypothetical protein J7643_19120 [bacterium]|nr:hypothetical protein [bacterium]
MQIKLSTGKIVDIVDEYGFDQELRAAELSEVPAVMTYADTILLNIASVMAAVTKIDGKGIQEVTGEAVRSKDLLKSFRKAFNDAEWKQLDKAFEEVYAKGPKSIGEYFILS